MVINMNKEEFIIELSKRLSCSLEEANIINNILEKHFFISKSSKKKIVDELILTLNIKLSAAENIYDEAILIIKKELKDKLSHPFKNLDK